MCEELVCGLEERVQGQSLRMCASRSFKKMTLLIRKNTRAFAAARFSHRCPGTMSHAPTAITRPDEFPLGETHGIALWPKNRLLSDSRGLGWHEVYTSLATERSWTGTLRPVPHYCLA
ncbi:MAG: hypothetical protein ABWZ88_21410 [Variovorax sp.]